MAIRDICVCIAARSDDGAAMALAQRIAQYSSAHISCAAISAVPTSAIAPTEYRGAKAFARLMEECSKEAKLFFEDVERQTRAATAPIEVRRYEIFASELADVAAMTARHADLVVIRAPDQQAPHPHVDLIEGALLGGGRPIAVAPIGWSGERLGQCVVVAWDASREVARALHDALPLLADGADVHVVTVDAEPGAKSHGGAPGYDICAHLARHGLHVKLHNEDSQDQTIAEALVRVAYSLEADLMVMGGYKHPRMQQAMWSGVTRTLLRAPPTPLLLAH